MSTSMTKGPSTIRTSLASARLWLVRSPLLLAAVLVWASCAPCALWAQDPNDPAGAASAEQMAISTEEERAFEKMAERTNCTTYTDDLQVVNIFFIGATPLKPRVTHRGPQTTTPTDSELLQLFSGVRVSSISITQSRKIAVVSFNNNSFRVHPGEPVLGNVLVKEIEKDRVMFQYPSKPAIWIYRQRPGMPPPAVATEQ